MHLRRIALVQHSCYTWNMPFWMRCVCIFETLETTNNHSKCTIAFKWMPWRWWVGHLIYLFVQMAFEWWSSERKREKKRGTQHKTILGVSHNYIRFPRDKTVKHNIWSAHYLTLSLSRSLFLSPFALRPFSVCSGALYCIRRHCLNQLCFCVCVCFICFLSHLNAHDDTCTGDGCT